MLGKAAFFVFLPALLFSGMAEADLTVLFSALLPVSAIAALACPLPWGVGSSLFGLTGAALIAVAVLAALPTAQDVYT